MRLDQSSVHLLLLFLYVGVTIKSQLETCAVPDVPDVLVEETDEIKKEKKSKNISVWGLVNRELASQKVLYSDNKVNLLQ